MWRRLALIALSLMAVMAQPPWMGHAQDPKPIGGKSPDPGSDRPEERRRWAEARREEALQEKKGCRGRYSSAYVIGQCERNADQWVRYYEIIIRDPSVDLTILSGRPSVPTEPEKPPFQIFGKFHLLDFTLSYGSKTACLGTGGYSDVHPAAQVTVTDETGKIIGVSSLGEGTLNQKTVTCEFTFVVGDLPQAAFYSVWVAASRRGKITHSFDELRAKRWRVTLSLGK